MKVLILVAALLGLGVCADLHGEAAHRSRVVRQAADVATLNDYFDKLVVNVRDWAKENGLDPMKIPDQVLGFDYKGLLVDWHGELDLTNGILKDISTLDRRGDIVLNYLNKNLKVSAVIGFGDLQFFFDYLAELMDLKYDGTAEGVIGDVTLEVGFDVDLENLKITIDNFHFDHAGELHVEIHGNGLLDLLPNAIADAITALFKDSLLHDIEGQIKNILQDTVDKIDLGSVISDIGGTGA